MPPAAPLLAQRDEAGEVPAPVPAPPALAETPEQAGQPAPDAALEKPALAEAPTPSEVPDLPVARADAGQLPVNGEDDPEARAEPEPEVITDRLPRIGDAPEEPEAEPEQVEEVLTEDALSRNAVAFDNPDGRPIVSVVLLDEGGPEVKLPVTFSIAIDAAAPDAGERAARYRAAGTEVVLIPPLPEGAQPSDVAVAMQDVLARMPQAVALMDTPQGKVQGNREALGQLVGILAETGHGFVTFPKGLNTAQQVAARAGVTSALVFRQIDGEGQDLRAVKRFLDQAAFRARQENAVILVGRNRPDTLAALAEWALGNRAASVALAPVSAALKVLEP
nr:divergent polysaccharide deacetylase family protein [Oceaniglobus trochenteri]